MRGKSRCGRGCSYDLVSSSIVSVEYFMRFAVCSLPLQACLSMLYPIRDPSMS